MTNVEALKNLYVALGGMIDDVEDFNLSVEVINAIAGIAGSGGSSLPAVTAEDNDKVLTVVNGEWDKAAPSGGDEIPMIHVAWNGSKNATIETGNEIFEMFSPEGVYSGVVIEDDEGYNTISGISKDEGLIGISYFSGPDHKYIGAVKGSNSPVIVN